MMVLPFYVIGPLLIGGVAFFLSRVFPGHDQIVRRVGFTGQAIFLLVFLALFFSMSAPILHLMLFVSGSVLASVIQTFLTRDEP